MMMIRDVRRMLPLLLGAALMAGACDSEPTDEGGTVGEKVTALNLQNGERKAFDNKEAVPNGWAICSDSQCAVFPPEFPCQNLGPGACLLNSECRLKMRCEFDLYGRVYGVASQPTSNAGTSANNDEVDVGSSPNDPSVPPEPRDIAPPGCEFVCVPGMRPITCGEIDDARRCMEQKDCVWEETQLPQPMPLPVPRTSGTGTTSGVNGGPGSFCPPDLCDPIPPRPFGYCRERTQLSCEELDYRRCETRPDCIWSPEICAMKCSGPDCSDMPCGAFCRTRPVEPVCPAVDAVKPDCADGMPMPIFDEQGCIVKYECQSVCPDIFLAPPSCPNGSLQKITDDRGCVVGYRCDQACRELAPIPPACPDGKIVPVYDNVGCLVAYRCDASANCNDIQKQYTELLNQAKQCVPFEKNLDPTTGALAPNLCGVTVSSGLGCNTCPTYVNVKHTDTIAKLRELERSYYDAGCANAIMCPAIACVAPKGATCEPLSGIGRCTDIGGLTR